MATRLVDRCATRAVAVLVLISILLGGCTAADSPGPRTESRADTTVPPDVDPSPSPAAVQWRALDGPLGRCGPQPPPVNEAPLHYVDIVEPRLGSVPAVRIGNGPTVAVLLHQVDGGGLCGWLPFASVVARDPGLSALVIDLCGYGEADCRKVTRRTFEDADQTDAVDAAIRFARRRMNADRVVVVGASMGGSVALMRAASSGGIDSAVSLSGPIDWAGMDAVSEGRRLRVPVLVAMADTEGDTQVAGARLIVANAPSGSTFLPVESGHGYELVTDDDGHPVSLADKVLAWLHRA